ncbi:MAG: outer membrane beta-barrel protein [Owenweeksia sp.]|nr:outer membrane beta-barrel protein [Owenweeksia sp.]
MKALRPLCTMVIALFSIGNAPAQLIPYAGFSVGYASSQLTLNPANNLTTEALPSFAIGAQMQWLDNPIIGMSTDVDYWRAGAVVNDASLHLNQLSFAQQLILYIPLVSKKWEWYLSGGPQMNYLLEHTNGRGPANLNLRDEGYEDWVFGWRFGTGVDYVFRKFKIFFTAEYLLDSKERYQVSAPQARSFKSSSLLFSLGYLYEL